MELSKGEDDDLDQYAASYKQFCVHLADLAMFYCVY